MRDLLLQACVVVRTSYMKISRCHFTDYVKKLHQKACRTFCGVFAVAVVAPAYGVCAYACVNSEKCAFEIDHKYH